MKQNFLVFLSITLFCLVAIMSSLTMYTFDVFGANQSNDTSLAKAFIWNTQPEVYNIIISPSPSINLNPGNYTLVNCTGYVYDYNGEGDIVNANATFYNIDLTQHDSADDNNNHYTNRSCACFELSATNVTCSCLFNVWYYATNGTWMCNFTAQDKGGNATERVYNMSSYRNKSISVNTVLGIRVPDEIDFGNLSVSEISSLVQTNISNWGNVPINVSLRGFGGTNESTPRAGNYSMLCEYGNISNGYLRYSLDGSTLFGQMTNLTNVTSGLNNFDLPVRTNDTAFGKDTNLTYWKLEVPLFVGGHCNGTVVFYATHDNG